MCSHPTPASRWDDFDPRDLAPKGRPTLRRERVLDHARALEHYSAMLEELAAQLRDEASS